MCPLLTQVAAPVLEGYNHQQKALFERERKESVESITPRARGGGRGVHNRDHVLLVLVTWAVVELVIQKCTKYFSKFAMSYSVEICDKPRD